MHGRAFGAALLTVTVSGCASIWEGRTQDITVSTDPPGAECGLYREEGQRIALIQRTPGSVQVRKTRSDIWIVCVKPGYQQSIYYNRSGGTLTNVVAGVLTLGISTAVDASTGADNKYESPANVVMLPVPRGMAEGPPVLPQTFAAERPAAAYSQQVGSPKGLAATPGAAPPQPQRTVAAVAVAPAPPVDTAPATPEPPVAQPARPVAATPAGVGPRYDGFYSGSVEVLDTDANPAAAHPRQVDVRVVNGVGSGTVRLGLCDQAGEVSFAIDPAGTIRGRANTRNTVGCIERMAMLEGRVDGQQMHLVLRLPGNPELVMARTQTAAAPSVPAAVASPRGRVVGDYTCALELAPGGARPVWLRVVGTKGTGSIRQPPCPQPGFMSVAIAADGSLSGDADILSGQGCTSQKATVSGTVQGRRMAVTLAMPDGQTSKEFVFTRRANGSGDE